MSSALTKTKYKPVIENYFNKIAQQDNLTSLNTAFSKEGAYIHIPKNMEVEKPIQIINSIQLLFLYLNTYFKAA